MRASSAGSSLASVDEGQPARCWWPSLSSNARPRATAARECRSSLTLPLRRSVSSSWRTSRPVRWSSATVWGPIQPPVVRTTGTRHSTSAHRGCQRTSHCQVFTGSPRSPSDGFSALTKAQWRPTTCRRTSTSSASVSTEGTREPRGLLFYRLMHLAVGAPPLTYRHLVVNPQPKRRRPIAPQGPRPQPGTLALPPAGRPWRQVTALE